MEEFKIICDNDFLIIKLTEVIGFPEKTCYAGGYECVGKLKIKSSNYTVDSFFSLSTGDIYKFYLTFKECLEKLDGVCTFESYEGNLKFEMTFIETGKVFLKGFYIENFSVENKLNFEIKMDQSYLTETKQELTSITKKYGDNFGIKNVC